MCFCYFLSSLYEVFFLFMFPDDPVSWVPGYGGEKCGPGAWIYRVPADLQLGQSPWSHGFPTPRARQGGAIRSLHWYVGEETSDVTKRGR